MGSDEINEVKQGLETVLQNAEQERQAQIHAEAQKKTEEIIRSMNVFATKEDVLKEIQALKAENEAFKQLLLRAKQQGKANIEASQNDQNSRLRDIYKGTSLEHAFDKP